MRETSADRVVLHHNSAVNTAVRTIVTNDPRVQVVDYGSLEYALTIHRTVGRVVWVSHGSEDVILSGAGIISWRSFGQVLDSHPGLDLVLACESAAVRPYTHSSKVLTFNIVVDAVIGGALVSYLLGFPSTSARERTGVDVGVGLGLGRGSVDVLLAGEKINPFQQAVERAARLAVGNEQPLFLYLSELEGAYWSAIINYTCNNRKVIQYPPLGGASSLW